jgi:hypothetical protein
MDLCWDCEQEITFITVKGIAHPIHESEAIRGRSPRFRLAPYASEELQG